MMLGQVSYAQKLDRGLSISSMQPFAQKGTWMIGGTASWTYHNNEKFKFLIADNLTSTGYSLGVSPAVCYMFANNMGAGMRFGYQRSMLKLDDITVGFGDMKLDIKDYHYLRHSFDIQGIFRSYIPIGSSKRIALYNEVQLDFKFGNGKVVSGNTDVYDGSYSNFRNIGLNFCPGITAFANDNLAVDINVSMLGLNFGNTEQTHNQVDMAQSHKMSLNFQINILAIGFGLYYYL